MTTPAELVLQNYTLPHTPFPKQIEAVNTLAPLMHAGLYAKVGTGKTLMATMIALYKGLVDDIDQAIIVMPPILVDMWERWIRETTGHTVTAYRGSPAKRKKLDLKSAFLLMSLPIFKKDFDVICKAAPQNKVLLVVDEATSIKNYASDNHKKVRNFSVGRHLLLMTGTPIAQPGDSYAYVKLLAPDVYRNRTQFENIHVASRDFFNNVKEWRCLELMRENMKINTFSMSRSDIDQTYVEPIYTPLPYQLDPEHQKLYERLCDEQILELENGGKIDATEAMRLYTYAQQLVLNWSFFSEDPKKIPAGFELLDQICEELEVGTGSGKLLVFANYKMSIAGIVAYLKRVNAAAINSDVSAGQKQINLKRFIEGDCGVLVIQPTSGGQGLDGLQRVCSDELFLEEPLSPVDFQQAVGRVDRTGQRLRPQIRLAHAENTIQVRLHKRLLHKDSDANFIQGGVRDLRDALAGRG